jgi:hypothetical protein
LDDRPCLDDADVVAAIAHANHLIVTKDQRKQMIRRIETAFGSMLDEKDMTYIVSSAWIIREGLRKDYNGDQPSSPPNGVSPRAIETSRPCQFRKQR